MKKLSAACLLCVSSSAMAMVPIDGWYASIFGGVSYVPDNINITTINGATYRNSKYNTGYDAGGNLGYKSNNLRYEFEGTYIEAKPKRFNINGITQTGVNGHTSASSGIVNVYVDFDGFIAPELQPYLGAGIGYAYVNTRLSSTGPLGNTNFKDTHTVFAYQGKAGLTYVFAENYSTYLGYRYFATNKVRNMGKLFQAHLANFGVTYRFDEAQYK